MQPISQPLSTACVAGSLGTQPLDLVGSDGRLELRLLPGSLDLSQATVPGGGAPMQPFTLQLSEIHGHFAGTLNLLGRYQLQVVDSQNRVVSGIRLHTPATIM